MEDCVVVQNLKEDNSKIEFNSSYIEKEIDMGFFENFIFGGNEKSIFKMDVKEFITAHVIVTDVQEL